MTKQPYLNNMIFMASTEKVIYPNDPKFKSEHRGQKQKSSECGLRSKIDVPVLNVESEKSYTWKTQAYNGKPTDGIPEKNQGKNISLTGCQSCYVTVSYLLI